MNGTLPVPRLVAWEVTRRCNLRCAHCRASAGDCVAEGELSLAEAKALVDDIATFAKPVLILTGGEPLMCEWIWDIITYAREKGMTPAVGTNGTLVDDATARRLAESAVRRISVSLDFPTAEAHDAFRGLKGAFDAAVAGIAAARRAGVEVQVNMTVTRRNWRLLGEMHDLAVRLGAQALHPFLLVPTGRGAGLSGEELSAAEYEEALGWVCRRKATSPIELKPTDAPQYRRIEMQCGASSSRGRGCLAGTGFVFVSHVGDVQPCGYFDMKLGNIREKPLSRIWRESPVLDDLRHPERLKGKCGACEYKAVCGGCRARALAVKGDYLAEEPNCAHVPQGTLLDALQTGFPICERPYRAIGERLGLSEDDCYARVRALREKGVIRRIGAAFSPRALGHVSTLVAFAIPGERVDAAADVVSASPFVTHNYRREGEYNLWFTLVAPSREKVAEVVEELRSRTEASKAMELPSRRAYKLRAVFDTAGSLPVATKGFVPSPVPTGETPDVPTHLIRLVQGDIIDLGPSPFSSDDASGLAELASRGVMRRFGAFLDHRSVGFLANALTVWQVAAAEADAIGAAFAGKPFVSHCVLRPAAPGWPFSLYAMVHARSSADLDARLGELDALAASAAGRPVPRVVLPTVREYKKSPPRYAV